MMPTLSNCQLFVCFCILLYVELGGGTLFVDAVSHSPISYNTLMVIVVLELVFAFSVGIICVIFSFNLFRALSDLDQNLPIGDLPSRYGKRSSLGGGGGGAASSLSPRSNGNNNTTPEGNKNSSFLSRNGGSRENLRFIGENNSNSNSNSATGGGNTNAEFEDVEEEIDIEYNYGGGGSGNGNIDEHTGSYSSQSGSVLQSFTDYVKFW
jgi:hypothetical protein